MLEESFLAADVHSVVGVQEQARETSCEVTHKIIWDGAQGLLHFGRQFPVMVLLISHCPQKVPDGATFIGSEFSKI